MLSTALLMSAFSKARNIMHLGCQGPSPKNGCMRIEAPYPLLFRKVRDLAWRRGKVADLPALQDMLGSFS